MTVQVRAVIVDIGGVLTSEGAWTWGQPWGVSEADLMDLLTRLDPEDGLTRGVRGEEWLRAALGDALGLDEPARDALMADLWDWYCGTPDEALLSWVRGLRGRVAVIALSNSADGARREEQRRYGFAEIFDDIVYSHEVALAKPDPRIYLLACERLQVEPTQAAFIDDRLENVEAARALGMFAVHHMAAARTIAEIEPLLGS
ncbi:MAG: HAD-IA family hydrolase [Actinomycetales bacterium]|nr:HAD-IA family hydrolase [Actinomycetales bacterium]